MDFSQLLPSQPLSPAELSQVERITTNFLEEEELLGHLSRDLEQLDDIDFPRLEEEQIICDVPLTFRQDSFDNNNNKILSMQGGGEREEFLPGLVQLP